MRRLFSFVVALWLLSGQLCFAAGKAGDDKEYFEEILKHMSTLEDWHTRPDPQTTGGAEQILNGGIYLVYNTSPEELEKLNQPLRSMGATGDVLMPEKMVAKAICKYYGLTISKYAELEKAARQKQALSGFYAMGASDPGPSDFQVDSMDLMKNGLLLVSGEQDVDMETPTPFKAYFQKSNCGGREHWVLWKFVHADSQ